MHRTQISLREDQYEALLRVSRNQSISLSELIRRIADHYLKDKEAAKSPLMELAGSGEGSGESVGRNHDRYLYGDRREEGLR